MGRIFLWCFLFVVAFKVIIKSIEYSSSTKVVGTVIELRESTTIMHHVRRTYKEEAIVPVLKYRVFGKFYTASDRYWGVWCRYEIGQKYNMMISDNPAKPELLGFFQFWFKLKDIAIIFCVSAILTIIIGTVKFSKKKS